MSSRTLVSVDKDFLLSARIRAGYKSQAAAVVGSGVRLRTWSRAETEGVVSARSAQPIARRLGVPLERLLDNVAGRTQTPQDASDGSAPIRPGRVGEATTAYATASDAGELARLTHLIRDYQDLVDRLRSEIATLRAAQPTAPRGEPGRTAAEPP